MVCVLCPFVYTEINKKNYKNYKLFLKNNLGYFQP